MIDETKTLLTDKITILITDDDSDILDVLSYGLEEFADNLIVIKANSGYQALRSIQTQKIDILVTDIAMPDIDGYELYKRAKEIRPKLPIIMMTGFGYDPNHTIVNSKKIGLKNVIFKPFEISKLLKMIYENLETIAHEKSKSNQFL